MIECDGCSKIMQEGVGHYSEFLDQTLCESCFDESHVYVEGTYYNINDSKVQELEDGEYVLSEDVAYVEYRREYHRIANCLFNSYLNEYVLKEDLS